MTCFVDATLTFAGSDEPCCLLQVANIGQLQADDTRRLSEALCGSVAEALSMDSSRIYIWFNDVERHMWGYAGRTFA
jgi:phenylpyruvate tautomerase PptA (4-oxalocrotonate tautomerase family)